MRLPVELPLSFLALTLGPLHEASTPLKILHKKRDGLELSASEVKLFVQGFFDGKIPKYQMSALLMALRINGMTPAETAAMTVAMMETGSPADLSSIPGFKVDKHSTGGVGDKTSLVLAPIVAAAGGLVVPMMSGRGLGHTGGTLDKLETIEGFRTDLSTDRFREVLREVGTGIIGPTADVAPVDREIYALRDVTATVDSVGLITASIMSKKLSEGANAIVLDVKTGSGAFMQKREDALGLARSMVGAGNAAGVPTVALITDMNQPLGRAVGNRLEVEESLEILQDVDAAMVGGGVFSSGGGRGSSADLVEVILALASRMFVLAGRTATPAAGRDLALEMLRSGKALGKFLAMARAQGGDPAALDELVRQAKSRNSQGGATRGMAAFTEDVVAWASGRVCAVDALAIGDASVLLGAGRQTIEDTISPGAGIEIFSKVGAAAERGKTVLATLHADTQAALGPAAEHIRKAYRICSSDEAADQTFLQAALARPLVISMVDVDGTERLDVSVPRPNELG